MVFHSVPHIRSQFYFILFGIVKYISVLCNNHNVEMRKTIKKECLEMNVIKKSNLLEGTSLDSVKKFMKNLK